MLRRRHSSSFCVTWFSKSFSSRNFREFNDLLEKRGQIRSFFNSFNKEKKFSTDSAEKLGGVDFLGNLKNKADLWPVQRLDDGSLLGHAKEMGDGESSTSITLWIYERTDVFVFLCDFSWMVGQPSTTTRQLWSSTDTYPADIHETHGRCAMLLSHSLYLLSLWLLFPGCLNSFSFFFCLSFGGFLW